MVWFKMRDLHTGTLATTAVGDVCYRHTSLFKAVSFQEVFSVAERIFSKTERGFYS